MNTQILLKKIDQCIQRILDITNEAIAYPLPEKWDQVDKCLNQRDRFFANYQALKALLPTDHELPTKLIEAQQRLSELNSRLVNYIATGIDSTTESLAHTNKFNAGLKRYHSGLSR